MTEGYPSLELHRSSFIEPPDESEILDKLIVKFSESVELDRLLASDRIDKLEEIIEEYQRGDQVVFIEPIINLLKKITCPGCNKKFATKHQCGSFVCVKCVTQNNYTCLGCNNLLSHEMIRKFFNKSLFCMECRSRVNNPCGHYCDSCILIIDKNSINECSSCEDQYNAIANTMKNCLKCSKKDKALNMNEFCNNHFLCKTCSTDFVETGKCGCGAIMNISKVEFIYRRTHFTCKRCNYCFALKDLNKSDCCNVSLCSFCCGLVCEFCLNPTFPIS